MFQGYVAKFLEITMCKDTYGKIQSWTIQDVFKNPSKSSDQTTKLNWFARFFPSTYTSASLFPLPPWGKSLWAISQSFLRFANAQARFSRIGVSFLIELAISSYWESFMGSRTLSHAIIFGWNHNYKIIKRNGGICQESPGFRVFLYSLLANSHVAVSKKNQRFPASSLEKIFKMGKLFGSHRSLQKTKKKLTQLRTCAWWPNHGSLRSNNDGPFATNPWTLATNPWTSVWFIWISWFCWCFFLMKHPLMIRTRWGFLETREKPPNNEKAILGAQLLQLNPGPSRFQWWEIHVVTSLKPSEKLMKWNPFKWFYIQDVFNILDIFFSIKEST